MQSVVHLGLDSWTAETVFGWTGLTHNTSEFIRCRRNLFLLTARSRKWMDDGFSAIWKPLITSQRLNYVFFTKGQAWPNAYIT